MFNSKEFLPPKIDSYLNTSATGSTVLVPQKQLPIFNSNFNFIGSDHGNSPYGRAFTENSIPTPVARYGIEGHYSPLDDTIQDFEPNKPPKEFAAPVHPSRSSDRTVAELKHALSRATGERSTLLAENTALKERVSVYEQKLSMMDAKFQQMMSRISALEKPDMSHSNISRGRRTAPRIMEPASPQSVHLRRPTQSSAARSVSAPKGRADPNVSRSGSVLQSSRSISAPRVRSNSVVSLSRNTGPSSSSSSGRLSMPSRNVAVAARSRIPATPTRNVVHVKQAMSPAAGSIRRAVSPGSVPVTPSTVRSLPVVASMKYELQVALNDQLIATCSLNEQIHPDGPFLYIVQSELSPAVTFTPNPTAENTFSGISITIVGTNTKTRKSNTIFKSHASHIETPPVSDGYFSHSCWLSGPGASIIGGVRVFFKPVIGLTGANGAVSLYALSLKYWFPDNTENESQNFSVDHWKGLLKLLGIL
jgi:hypothetical protein